MSFFWTRRGSTNKSNFTRKDSTDLDDSFTTVEPVVKGIKSPKFSHISIGVPDTVDSFRVQPSHSRTPRRSFQSTHSFTNASNPVSARPSQKRLVRRYTSGMIDTFEPSSITEYKRLRYISSRDMLLRRRSHMYQTTTNDKTGVYDRHCLFASITGITIKLSLGQRRPVEGGPGSRITWGGLRSKERIPRHAVSTSYFSFHMSDYGLAPSRRSLSHGLNSYISSEIKIKDRSTEASKREKQKSLELQAQALDREFKSIESLDNAIDLKPRLSFVWDEMGLSLQPLSVAYPSLYHILMKDQVKPKDNEPLISDTKPGALKITKSKTKHESLKKSSQSGYIADEKALLSRKKSFKADNRSDSITKESTRETQKKSKKSTSRQTTPSSSSEPSPSVDSTSDGAQSARKGWLKVPKPKTLKKKRHKHSKRSNYQTSSESSTSTSSLSEHSTIDSENNITDNIVIPAQQNDKQLLSSVRVDVIKTQGQQDQATPPASGPSHQSTPFSREKEPKHHTPLSKEKESLHQSTPDSKEKDSKQQSTPVSKQKDSPLPPVPLSKEKDSSQTSTTFSRDKESRQKPSPRSIEKDSSQQSTPVSKENDSPHQPTPVSKNEDSQQQSTPVSKQKDSPLPYVPLSKEKDSPQPSTPFSREKESRQKSSPLSIEKVLSQRSTPVSNEKDSPQQSTPSSKEKTTPEKSTPSSKEKTSPQQPMSFPEGKVSPSESPQPNMHPVIGETIAPTPTENSSLGTPSDHSLLSKTNSFDHNLGDKTGENRDMSPTAHTNQELQIGIPQPTPATDEYNQRLPKTTVPRHETHSSAPPEDSNLSKATLYHSTQQEHPIEQSSMTLDIPNENTLLSPALNEQQTEPTDPQSASAGRQNDAETLKATQMQETLQKTLSETGVLSRTPSDYKSVLPSKAPSEQWSADTSGMPAYQDSPRESAEMNDTLFYDCLSYNGQRHGSTSQPNKQRKRRRAAKLAGRLVSSVRNAFSWVFSRDRSAGNDSSSEDDDSKDSEGDGFHTPQDSSEAGSDDLYLTPIRISLENSKHPNQIEDQ